MRFLVNTIHFVATFCSNKRQSTFLAKRILESFERVRQLEAFADDPFHGVGEETRLREEVIRYLLRRSTRQLFRRHKRLLV